MRLFLKEKWLVEYSPLSLGLVLAGVGSVGALVAPAYSLAAFALALLGLAMYRWTPSEDRWAVLWIVGLSLAFRLIVLVALHLLNKAQGWQGFLSGDARLYFLRASEFSEYLDGNKSVPFSIAHGVNVYSYFCGFVFWLTRKSVFMLKVLNVCVSLAATFGFYRWSREEFGRRAGLLVLVFVAFYPSLTYWSITNLKEPHIMLILMVGLWSACRLIDGRKPWPFWALISGGAVLMMRGYNLYLAIGLGLAITLGWLFDRYPRQMALALFSALVGGAWLYWTREPVARMVSEFLFDQVAYYQLSIARSDVAGYILYPYDYFRGTFPIHLGPHQVFWTSWLASWFKGLGYFLFSPFPWAIKTSEQLMAYPQILFWYGLFPFVLYGVWVCPRTNRPRVMPLVLFVIGLVVVLAAISGNVGQAFRHRDWISPFCLMFAGIGLLHFLGEPELTARLRASS